MTDAPENVQEPVAEAAAPASTAPAAPAPESAPAVDPAPEAPEAEYEAEDQKDHPSRRPVSYRPAPAGPDAVDTTNDESKA